MKNQGCTKTRISHKVGMSSVHLRHRPDGSLHSRKETQRYTELYTNSKGETKERVKTVTTTRQYRGSFEYDGSAWIYHTPCGFINLKDNGVHYYARDYQGSTRAVYKSNEVQIAPLALGNGAIVRPNLRTIEQATDYYPSGLPVDVTATVTPSLATAVTDRLHIGNRWMNHSGLSLYDNTARIYDPLTVRFHTPDPLDYKRPWDSPWAHCAGNPANFIDPDGRIVVADNWCQQGILDGLPEDEANLISFDENGTMVFDPDIDLEGKSINFNCLITLGKSSTNYIVEGATSAMVGDELKVFTEENDDAFFYGVTLMPGIEESPSPDENVHVYTSTLISPQKRASNIAHELYGHAYFFEKGANPLHTSIGGYEVGEEGLTTFPIRTNKELENHISNVVNCANESYRRRYNK